MIAVGVTAQIQIAMSGGVSIERPNQEWAIYITSLPMARGFVSLAIVVDWLSRRVLALVGIDQHEGRFPDLMQSMRRLPNMADRRVFNTDQGSQFASALHMRSG